MNKAIFGALLAIGVAATSSAFAQQPAAPAPAATPAAPAAKVAIPSGVFYKGQGPQQYFAKDRLIGVNVVNKDGAVIGDIEDVILNTSNEIEGVLIGTGGMLGVGEKKIGVRYSALVFEKKDGKTIIKLPAATKDVLAAVEAYKRTEKKSLLDKAKERAQGMTERTKEGAGPALEKAKEAGKAALDKTKEVGKAAVEKGKEVIDAAKDKAAPQKQ